jgi:gentisate 1,2-dioxygenase
MLLVWRCNFVSSPSRMWISQESVGNVGPPVTKTFDWNKGDSFTIPQWQLHCHETAAQKQRFYSS